MSAWGPHPCAGFSVAVQSTASLVQAKAKPRPLIVSHVRKLPQRVRAGRMPGRVAWRHIGRRFSRGRGGPGTAVTAARDRAAAADQPALKVGGYCTPPRPSLGGIGLTPVTERLPVFPSPLARGDRPAETGNRSVPGYFAPPPRARARRRLSRPAPRP